MKPNDIKKGMVVETKDGVEVTVQDNRKGNIRLVETPVFGMEDMTSMGSMYAHDWHRVKLPNGEWELVEHDKKSNDRKKMIESILGGWR